MSDSTLHGLAERWGVATSWQDQLDRTVEVGEDTLRAVLDVLGVDPVSGDGPVDSDGDGDSDGDAAPDVPAIRPLSAGPRGWGWMVQLYAIRSAGSWGIGDFADLRTLVHWTAAHGGDVVLVNPLHAVTPVEPMQPSPYFPASRRWLNPVYLRIEDLPEYARAEATLRRRIDALKPVALNDSDRIDRDASWAAKRAALELLFDPADVTPPTDEERGWATWAALVEVHGPDWREWPEALRDPASPAVAEARESLVDRVAWHTWLQRRSDEQCRAAQEAARAAGMRIGVMHDLAVGTDPGGADAWEWQGALALGARIGAPPDEFNQKGQDWGMPPWHPQRLAALGYAPLRELVRSQLRRGGGLRIDHVLGLFRMWWIPEGASADGGTYVAYDAEALLGVITEEAAAAGAVVVGEDLGTVPKHVFRALADAGVLGTSLLLFEREDSTDGAMGPLKPLSSWREAATASVSTHDLPTPLGWLRGEHVRIRAELDLLRDVDREWAGWRVERAELVESLTAAGLVEAGADDLALAAAMQRALPRTPSRLVLAAPGDAVGDVRQPNLPGTTDAYPNWRLAVTDDDGAVVGLEQLLADRRTAALAADLGSVATRGGR